IIVPVQSLRVLGIPAVEVLRKIADVADDVEAIPVSLKKHDHPFEQILLHQSHREQFVREQYVALGALQNLSQIVKRPASVSHRLFCRELQRETAVKASNRSVKLRHAYPQS